MGLFLGFLFIVACGNPKSSKGDDDPSNEADADRDGVTSADGDCDDEDPNISPTATDLVGDDIDQNCDGVDGIDVDHDDVASTASGGTDCADTDSTVSPNVTEVPYDGVDNDCSNGDITDVDGDGVAGGASGPDCDDGNASVFPGATDEPYDGVDADCSGNDDYDADADGVPVWDDCDDENPALFPGAAVNEPEICTTDADGDGYGDINLSGSDCDDTDASDWEIGPSGLYSGTATRSYGGYPFEWYCLVDGNTWWCGGDAYVSRTYYSDYGTFDEFGRVNSYTISGCTPPGRDVATGSVCGGTFTLTVSWISVCATSGDGYTWTGTH